MFQPPDTRLEQLLGCLESHTARIASLLSTRLGGNRLEIIRLRAERGRDKADLVPLKGKGLKDIHLVNFGATVKVYFSRAADASGPRIIGPLVLPPNAERRYIQSWEVIEIEATTDGPADVQLEVL